MPLFSVVIPTYNRLSLLRDTFESVRRQSYSDFELIVVDDGSTDATRDWLTSHKGAVRVIEQSNRGPGAARNLGVREARGDYVAFLDSDDLWFPWTLNAFAHAIRRHGGAAILGGKLFEFTEESELFAIRNEPLETSWFPDYIASARHPYYVGSGTCVLHREVLEKAKFLEDRLNAEDHDLILQLGTLPGFVRILAPLTLAWRRHPTSETGDFTSRVSGAQRLLARERSGAYPGGVERLQERQRIITRHIRPTALACLWNGELTKGWKLYCSIIGWNVVLGHWKYVVAFPMAAVLTFLRNATIRKPRVL